METDKTGIVACSSWDEAMRVLQGGLLVESDAAVPVPKEKAADIEIFKFAAAR